MATLFPQPYTSLDIRQPLDRRLAELHGQIRRQVPAVERLAFALYEPRNDLLSTYASHSCITPNLTFYDHQLATIPSLSQLAASRQCRVIDDMLAELPPISLHTRWLLQQGWRSSYTVPLHCGGELLGFLFLNAIEPGLFTADLLQRLQPWVELSASLILQEMGLVHALRQAVQLALHLADLPEGGSADHVERVALYSRLIAMELGHRRPLPPDFAADLYGFASLADVGRQLTTVALASKPGRLSVEERRAMDAEVLRGVELVDALIAGLRLVASPKAQMLHRMLAGRHELLDGSGYPFGLENGAIALEARIVAVADIYDALPAEAAEATLLQMATDGKLDRACVDALLGARQQRHAIAAAYRDP
ncbi:HD domain-containing phosphohydrolase [Synechococcus sp. CCY9201]|uniref:HD-GYP domain-containing protein n=1 Tax=unclassified Synechococcus TaxID=2626047 RepID=UPI0018CE965A|nr:MULTISPECIES: HD domain-containing phosphohydrolase [unclassified Synechococcus]MEA5423693.1 HD domain-containing phosphohydrolase [Synechococcus sp. CCY9202]MEA5474603.1 HD domain-containing phosphohydrolase [Synechococcus sp. CCY9201]QPN67689.1 metal-dependent phosphohydrolase [Synechococcus sp. CBW1006]CAK6687972.1 hypothetical protein IFHNHDMJ_00309 [Synechococcus sp. CBW1107]